MPNESPAAQFIAASVNHPEWLKAIEEGSSEDVVRLAKENGFDCTKEDLQAAAKEVLEGGETAGEKHEPSKAEIDEAASGMTDLSNDTGYGDDTGYAALFGVAGTILKM